MAASPVLTSNYNGDPLEYIITEAVIGNEAIQKKSFYVVPNVNYKLNIGKMVSTANPIVDREAMPTVKSATVTWSEAVLQPVEMMIYIPDINPRIFESEWRPFQPSGALPNRVLDPMIQKTFVDIVSAQAQFQIGKLLWQGDTTLASTNAMHFFNGMVTRAAASATNIDVTNAGVITSLNVISILESVLAAIPNALFDNPNFVIHMNTGDFRKFQQADRQLSYKGSGPSDEAKPMFAGKEIRYYSGFPANKILASVASAAPESNQYAATDKVTDSENFIIEKLRPEGEFYFLKALFKMDANFRIDSESVYYAGS